jgi:uncharacterized protein (TIGR02246 family)
MDLEMEAQVRRLLDVTEMSRLLVAFGAALDEKDWVAYAETFTEDGTFEIMGQVRRGREEIAAGPERDLARYDRLQHFSSNHRIQVGGDAATASHYLIAVQVPDGRQASRHADVGGRFVCECRRTPQGWKLSRPRVEVLWTGGQDVRIEEA